MKLNRIQFVAILIASLTASSVRADAASKDIVDTAVAAGSFKTLAAALEAGDLIKALKGKGPFTVFAPTDEAFAKLPAGTVEDLLKPENREALVGVLTYHVVAGKVPAAKVVKLSSAVTLNGQRVDVAAKDGVTVDKANVVKTDIHCSNGVIHVIDSVLLPSSDNIPATAYKAGKFKTLLAAAKAAGLVDALSGKGPLTVFAPTDDAFEKLPAGTVESLLKPENRAKLAGILKYHVVSGRVFSDAALKAKTAKTLQGSSLTIAAKSGGAYINDAKLLMTDIDASNGVIHVIDTVLLPEAKKQVSAVEAKQMIEHAVARGAKLYNSGHHQACAEVYQTTVTEMVQYGHQMPPRVMTELQNVITHASKTNCASTKAWALRHGLDSAYATLSSN